MRRVRMILAAFALLAGALLVPASPAAAAGHTCDVIGSSGGVQAVHCIDVFKESNVVFAMNSVYCQTPGGSVLECDGIQEKPGVCYSQISPCRYAGQGVCGTVWGHSRCGQRKVDNFSPNVVTSCNPSYRYWGISAGTVVALPNGVVVGPASIATPRYAVC